MALSIALAVMPKGLFQAANTQFKVMPFGHVLCLHGYDPKYLPDDNLVAQLCKQFDGKYAAKKEVRTCLVYMHPCRSRCPLIYMLDSHSLSCAMATMKAVSQSANVLNKFLGAAGGTQWQLSMARVRMLHNEMDAAKVNGGCCAVCCELCYAVLLAKMPSCSPVLQAEPQGKRAKKGKQPVAGAAQAAAKGGKGVTGGWTLAERKKAGASFNYHHSPILEQLLVRSPLLQVDSRQCSGLWQDWPAGVAAEQCKCNAAACTALQLKETGMVLIHLKKACEACKAKA
jgi:hypothetical protein